MLKFKGPFETPIYHNLSKVGKNKKYGRIYTTHEDISIPTVDEVYETIAPMTSDTVLQILHGQGIYWGPRYNAALDLSGARLPVLGKKNSYKNHNGKYHTETIDSTNYSTREERKEKFEQISREEEKPKSTEKLFFKSFYNAMDKKEQRAVQLIAQINKIPLQEAFNKYMDAIRQVEHR